LCKNAQIDPLSLGYSYMPLITKEIDQAVHELRKGKPVAIPTETVYGLAAPINNEEAIKAVFAIKNRPLNHPLIVHVAAHWDLSQFVSYIPDYAQKFIDHFWPGPLTLVLSCTKEQINPLINGGQTTVAIRCPAHPVAQKLLNKLQIALVAPSANPFGKISPTTAVHVQESFPNQEFTILDGGRCSLGIESTIVDATHPDHYQILRHGLINEQALAAVTTASLYSHQNTIRVPGKLESHYQPNKTLYYFTTYTQLAEFCQHSTDRVYVIASQKPSKVLDKNYQAFSKDPKIAAFNLYFQLRKADDSDAQYILIELPPVEDLWRGVRERILKAGSLF
jgi:L-threonylcarbamoyladenylate synthase